MNESQSLEEWLSVINKNFVSSGGIVYSSSGSTGEARDVIYTDYVINGAARRTTELLSLVPHRLKSMKVVVLWGYGVFPPAHFYSLSMSRLGCQVYPFGSGRNFPTDPKVDKIHKISPNILVGMPSYLIKIASCLDNKRILQNVRESLRFVVTGGEVLTSDIRKRLEDMYGVRVYDHYGMLQAPMIAGDCIYGHKHISKEYTPEILTSSDHIESWGEGTLLLSNNSVWEGVSMKRLNTQDRVKLYKCKCDTETTCVEVLGRDNLTYKVRGQLIDFDKLFYLLDNSGCVGDYYFEVISDPTDSIYIHIDNNVDAPNLRSLLNNTLPVKYEVLKEDSLKIPRGITEKEQRLVFRRQV